MKDITAVAQALSQQIEDCTLPNSDQPLFQQVQIYQEEWTSVKGAACAIELSAINNDGNNQEVEFNLYVAEPQIQTSASFILPALTIVLGALKHAALFNNTQKIGTAVASRATLFAYHPSVVVYKVEVVVK